MPETVAGHPPSPLRSIASIMVQVDWDVGCDDRIRLAADLANRCGAVLIGVAGWVPEGELARRASAKFATDEERLKWISAELDRLGERFRAVAGATEHPPEWRGSFHLAREVIVREARAADLIVIGSHPAADDTYHAFDPGSVLVAAGRPVLVAPDAVARLDAQRVLIAWKETREARRAVQSALPFLQAAEHVVLLAVAEDVLEADAQAQLGDIEAFLRRHRVAVGAKTVLRPHGSASEQIKDAARSEKADLIVAGAYGHTRLGEWIFGGVTRDLLRTSKVCCLFST
jgi:nucleotide-binding universal stress UspA family protein